MEILDTKKITITFEVENYLDNHRKFQVKATGNGSVLRAI
jgi:hypothetical protein